MTKLIKQKQRFKNKNKCYIFETNVTKTSRTTVNSKQNTRKTKQAFESLNKGFRIITVKY